MENSVPAVRQEQISIPIPVFPPFKLRSSLIDKDPVIWEYLLADYITLFKKLIAFIPISKPRKNNTKKVEPPPYVLSPKTINQLHEFISSFLHESSLESTQVFSLGAINPTIRQNQHVLKLAVYSYIKEANFVNLKITGVSIWEFCKVYITIANKYSAQGINQALVTIPTVRKLVEGTIKSNYTSKSDDVSVIRSLQDYLGNLIASGKWRQEDYEMLYSLLGQRTKKSLNQEKSSSNNQKKNFKNVKVNKGDANGSDFAEKFVDLHWIQILEELFAGGEGVNSKAATQIIVVSLCSLSSTKIIRLLKDKLEIDSMVRLKQFHPLIANVVLSKKFNELNPDLREMLIVLLIKKKDKKLTKGLSIPQFDQESIQNVQDMFPQLTVGQIKTLLHQNGSSVENVINKMLESNLNDLSTIEDFDDMQKNKNAKSKKSKKTGNTFEFKDNDKVYEVQIGKNDESYDLDDVDADYKKKVLERSLALLYQADEDEPDDTYVENETTTSKNIRAVDDGEALSSAVDSKSRDAAMQIEYNTFSIYQSSPDLFKRPARKTPQRETLKKETGWSDEQIEGWARMLEKTPQRYKMYEERFLFSDGSLNKSGKKANKWSAKKSNDSEGVESDERTPSIAFRGPSTKNNSNFQNYMNKKKKNEKGKAKAMAKTSNKPQT